MNKSKLLMLMLLPAIFCAAGCYQIVKVTDPAGDPVVDAKVTTRYASGDGGGIGQTAKTNRWGQAWLTVSDTSKSPAWLEVQKKGYQSKGIAYTLDNKIYIEIVPYNNAPR